MLPGGAWMDGDKLPIIQDEVSGPVLAGTVANGFDLALTLANDPFHRLSGFVRTNDGHRPMAASERLNVAEISCSRANREQVQGFPSGRGQSGLGGENGKHGFDGDLWQKTMSVNGA